MFVFACKMLFFMPFFYPDTLLYLTNAFSDVIVRYMEFAYIISDYYYSVIGVYAILVLAYTLYVIWMLILY